jgi:prepilin-type N-terminal cleavage/methylation domain-containing protein
MRSRSHTFGFTLIELLAVIAVILILFSLLIPLVGYANYKGKTILCLNAKQQYMQCMTLHASDNEGKYPNDYKGWMIMNPHDIEWTMLLKLENYGCRIDWVMCTMVPKATADATIATYEAKKASPPDNPKWILPGSSYWVMRGAAGAPASGENMSPNMNILSDRVSKHSSKYVVFCDSVIWHPAPQAFECAHNYGGQVREFTAVYGDGHGTITHIEDAKQRYTYGWDPWCW